MRLRKRYVLYLLVFAYAVYWVFCLPNDLFTAPQATELLSTEGELLSARIAADGQWRMPAADSVSRELVLAVLTYEDRNFYDHAGVSPTAVVRALAENWRAGKVVSGGSTITMQVARMARGNRARTLVQKMVEASWATRLEFRYSKEEILHLWLTHAPFGGNVVGAEAAALRYYGRPPDRLSWAEAATLAVLPNSPGLIHPGRARDALRRKRDELLDDLVDAGHLAADEAALAKLEPLPAAPLPRPRDADHLLERLRSAAGPGRYRTSLEADLQRQVTQLVAKHQQNLARNQVKNVACLVSEVATGRVVAYVGNAPNLAPAAAPAVDIVTSPRSPGSLLKPVLFALATDDGTITPRRLLPDVPSSFGAFRPANFHLEFDGAVSANEALARSLNVPFVHLLRSYGVERFHDALQPTFRQTDQPTGHYGLSLILGGGEITMEEIHGWFLGLARQQRYFHRRQGRYDHADWLGPTLLHQPRHALTGAEQRIQEFIAGASHLLNTEPRSFSAGAGFVTLEALRELQRPDENGSNIRFDSRRPIAWKTGTSFGFRDAWAVGATPAYVVSVWAGNADGEGRPGLVGVRAAAPLMFRIFRLLEGRQPDAPRWFEPPLDDLRQTITCTTSGYLAGPDCPRDTAWLPVNAERSAVCALHQKIYVSPDGRHQVKQDCGPGPAQARVQFTLPVDQSYFYQRNHANYRVAPPFHPACGEVGTASPMAFIYPYRNGVLQPGRNWEGGTEPILFELAHQRSESAVHWHLDGEFLATTRTFHSVTLLPQPGRHQLTVVDEDGKQASRSFIIRR